MGKDLNDIFWAIGKIHGLENIAYLTKEQIENCTGPIHLQEMVNQIE